MEEVLKAEKLHKYFYNPSAFHVLNNISLSVKKGEFVSVTGKSGSGKSTLLYLLSTLDTNYEGTVEINNTRVTGLREHQLAKFRNEHIGFIFQFHYLLPEFTVLQNVMIPALKLKRYNARAIEKLAREKLAQVEMEAFAHQHASKLSGGQQQRVAIVRALINEPDIIMADEPTGNLDSVNSAIVFDILRTLANKGNTIIAVTHDVDFAKGSDRSIDLVDGMITTSIAE